MIMPKASSSSAIAGGITLPPSGNPLGEGGFDRPTSVDCFTLVFGATLQFQVIDQLAQTSMNYLNLFCLRNIIQQMEGRTLFHQEMRTLSDRYLLDYRDETPQEIFELGIKISSRKGESFDMTTDFNLQETDRIWGFGEHRLFSWLSVWLMREDPRVQNLQTKSRVPESVRGVERLQLIFETKSTEFLLYEFKTIVSRDRKLKSFWKESERSKLKKIMQEYLRDPQNRKKMVRWKYVSYCLFLESDLEVFHTPQQCREQWINHLNPEINKSEWTRGEDSLLFGFIREYGCRWSVISRKMPTKRSEHMIKNRYHSVVKDWCRRKEVKSFNVKELGEMIRELNDSVEASREMACLKIEDQSHLEVKQLIERTSQRNRRFVQRKMRELKEEHPEALPYIYQMPEVPIKTRAKRIKEAGETQDSKSTSKHMEEIEPLCEVKIQNAEEREGNVTYPFLHCITDEEWYHDLEEKTHLSWLMID